jgi:hypothetical protein
MRKTRLALTMFRVSKVVSAIDYLELKVIENDRRRGERLVLNRKIPGRLRLDIIQVG